MAQDMIDSRLERLDALEAKMEELVTQLHHLEHRLRLQLIAQLNPKPRLHRRVTNLVKRWVKKGLGQPLIGVLAQYAPRPVHIPRRYTKLPKLRTLPTLSVVTPSYNQGGFLRDTLDSVLNQNYPQLEYVVQDGGSTDETLDLLEEYRPRLTHCDSRPDRGQAHAINRGFEHTHGEIMAWLNSDDMLLPGTLHYVASYFEKNPKVDVVYGHRVLIDEESQEIGRWVLPPHENEVLSWVDYIPQETLFWRRRIWEKVDSRLDESFRFALDWDLLIRFREAGARFHRLPRFLGSFRVHEEQKTLAVMAEIGEKDMARIRERCLGRPVSHEEINNAIRRYLYRHCLYQRLYSWGLARY